MINARQLLADLTRLLKRLEDDLRHRIADVPELKVSLQREWQTARDAYRTAETFESWADQVITQAGVHWLLSCVFLRFIEDNDLVDRPWLGGTPSSGRLDLARDRHEAYFRAHPLESDRDYLLAAFREAGALPGLHTFFDETHNPLFRLGISGDAAMAVRQFWQQVDPNTGALLHDFTDSNWNTRFLGDLYQDLSEAARKRYALLQTPEFVEEFILDRTLTPAITEFGYRDVRMIDPTCGSGHFLLGGFHRLVAEWVRHEPARNARDIAQRALDAVAGIDLNPFAVAISRFRLLVAALNVSSVYRLIEAPDFKLNLAIGDSLLHGKRFGLTATEGMFEGSEHYASTGLAHAYVDEDLGEVQRILGRQYHAVVGNPPYIVVRDAARNTAYRKRYISCHRKYSLGAPFTERFFELAVTGHGVQPAGFVGLITTNSFMKREFGSKLIEHVLPQVDLTHVVDTSGAYIPGHGTPTVILFGRHRAPVGRTVRTVMGVTGEPSTPVDPANGYVWSAIVRQIDIGDSNGEFISVSDIERHVFGKHPWSIGGGGVADVKEAIESAASQNLCEIANEIGVFGMTNADEIFLAPESAFRRQCLESAFRRKLVVGDLVRDWVVTPTDEVLFPYRDQETLPLEAAPRLAAWLWPCRTVLGNRATFAKSTYFEEGRPWWAWHQVALQRLSAPLTITFAFVATHNHFMLDRGGKVFNRSAPVIKLTSGASDAAHLGLLGLLNSSVACFWLKQVCHNKGSTVDQHGARQRTAPFEDFFEVGITPLKDFPLANPYPADIAGGIDVLAQQLIAIQPASLLAAADDSTVPLPTRASLDIARANATQIRKLMIGCQEELDWRCYGLYGLLPGGTDHLISECRTPVEVALGERAFEIVLARRVVAGDETTTWFERHGSAPITEIPIRWPEDYRRVVQRRLDLIESDRNIGLVERPEYKRRWSSPSWESMEQAALREWLLNRLESPRFWVVNANQPPRLSSARRLADAARYDDDFMQMAELYAGHADFDPGLLVADLVVSESVPFLPALRYTETGLRKRTQWEDTWALQRREDAGDEVCKIPVPPKYQNKDFLDSNCWRLRGGLDVPKERWISYPGCERGADTSLVIAWAGWNHLQQATAVAGYYLEMKDSEGWEHTRLQPLLVGLLELVPWLEQWHNEIDPVYGERMGTYYKSFVGEEARTLGFTLDALKGWSPPAVSARGARKKTVRAS